MGAWAFLNILGEFLLKMKGYTREREREREQKMGHRMIEHAATPSLVTAI
jgi:hypothetical protein